MNYNKFLTFTETMVKASRIILSPRFLIIIFPFFAFLMYKGIITSPFSITLIFPFITAISAGFTYNMICDVEKDPKTKNSIARGEISKKNAIIGTYCLLVVSIILFLLIYTSKIAFVSFLVYLFLWMGYSGLKIRFKETLLAPIVASIVLWIGAPLILLIEFNYFNTALISLLLGLFLIYIGHEIKHTLIEYEMDKSYNCKTFAVTFGRKNSAMIEYLVIMIGYVFLIMSMYFFGNASFIWPIIVFIGIFMISIISTALYGYKVNYSMNHDNSYIVQPYISTKIFLIVYGCIILNLPLLLIFFIVWIYLIEKHP